MTEGIAAPIVATLLAAVALPAYTGALVLCAPYVSVRRVARGDGAWIAIVARTPSDAITGARPFVATPRYALLRQARYGNDLRLQHWVRP